MNATEKVLVGAAVLYGAVVLGTRTTAMAAIGTHEAFHAYLEGGSEVTFQGDPYRDSILRGTTYGTTRDIPHIIPKAAGWLVAGALLLPWLWGVSKVAE